VTDTDLIKKKLAFIETCVRELTEIADPDRLDTDIREQRFVQHTLQLAIQAALDVASHIVSTERLGEPETNRQLFDRLVQSDWLKAELTERLHAMAGLRNILVHGYRSVDNRVIRDILENHLGDLLGFVAEIRTRLPRP
jgi:uncharacterized protein YutE (UPF0331/DUF86 family)